MALSSTRVMGTCSLLGQAVGTAAALAARDGLSPRGVGRRRIAELQELLMDDDCRLPGRKRSVPGISRKARLTASSGDPEPLRNGVDRSLGEDDNGWWVPPGGWAEYRFERPAPLTRARFVFDTCLSLERRMPSSYPKKGNRAPFPGMLCRDFDLLVQGGGEGGWRVVKEVRDNYLRLVKVPLAVTADAIRFVPRRSWGGKRVHLFAFDIS